MQNKITMGTHFFFILGVISPIFWRPKTSIFRGFWGPKVVGGFKPVGKIWVGFDHFPIYRDKNKRNVWDKYAPENFLMEPQNW